MTPTNVHPNEPLRPFEILRIPPSLSFLAPALIDDLIRVGNSHDGGYVIPRRLVDEVDFLISFGLSDDWSFDEHFLRLNPSLRIHAYDHTISRKMFAAQLQRAIIRACIVKPSGKGIRDRFRLLRSYDTFFSGPARHFAERVHNRADRSQDVTLDTVFERTTSERIFLKIDIEGSEYRIIDDILRYANRIAGIVIEFHDTDPLREVFETSVKKLQGRFEIAHLHMNNWGGIGRDGLPEVLELTLVKKAGTGIGKRRTTLPIFSVDSPNIPRMKDYAIEFAF